MKNLFYAGCCLTGFSFFQMLGQIIRGFPGSRGGAIALAIFGFFIIISFGFYNWIGLWYQTSGVIRKHQSTIAFGLVYVFGGGALFALTVGYLLGG